MDLKDHVVPLKKEMPTLYYDIALYCQTLKQILPVPFPEYLDKFSKKVSSFAGQVSKYMPNDFPDDDRVYIIDNRLNVCFAGFDKSGKITEYIVNMRKYTFDVEDYYYGNGDFVGDAKLPDMNYNKKELLAFRKMYGFIPTEEFAMASAVTFDGDQIVVYRLLSQFQTMLIMEKYRRKNLIDWKQYVDNAPVSLVF